MDREYGQQGGGDEFVHSREGRGQPNSSHDEAHLRGRPASSGPREFVREVAEAFDELMIPMFEGYMVSMKDHISNEVSKVMKSIEATNDSIAAVEKFVKSEFAILRKASTGDDIFPDDPFSGYSPDRPSFAHHNSSPSPQTNHGTAPIRNVKDSSETDGNAVAVEKFIPSATATSDPNIVPTETLCEKFGPFETAPADPNCVLVEKSVPSETAPSHPNIVPSEALCEKSGQVETAPANPNIVPTEPLCEGTGAMMPLSSPGLDHSVAVIEVRLPPLMPHTSLLRLLEALHV
ncbi:hypothetical protein Rs2_38525 [Raphanus sativus]|nr:hypothetical protein Rs2_38525 [Raphanus sativus]